MFPYFFLWYLILIRKQKSEKSSGLVVFQALKSQEFNNIFVIVLKTRISRKKPTEYEFQSRRNRSFVLLKDVVKVRKETRKCMQNWTLTLLCIYLSMHLALFEVLIARAIANEAGLGIATRYHTGCNCQISSYKFISQ